MKRIASLVAALLIAGCSSSGGGPAAVVTSAPPPSASPEAPASAAASPAATPTGTAARAIYYLHDGGRGPRLYREFHSRPATTGVIRDAVTAMLTERAYDGDYTSLWPTGTVVRGARVDADIA